MSFKRDGHDSGLLSILQKRRIKDLLAEDIPEDEAKLLSNGRFTCLVCHSNPIFDTVDMLCVHRKGKKHKSSAEQHEIKKEEIKQLIAKRRHEQFVNTGSTSIRLVQSHCTGISTSSPYDSRARRSNKTKMGDRKPRVDLHLNANAGSDSNTNTPSLNHHVASELEIHNQSPSSSSTSTSSPWQMICEQQIHGGSVKHDYKLKNIFHKKNNAPVRLHPYTSKHRTTSSLNKSNEEVSSPVSNSKSCAGHSPSSSIICGQVNHTKQLIDTQSVHQFHGREKVDTLNPYPSGSFSMSTTNISVAHSSSSVPPQSATDSSPVPQPQLSQSQPVLTPAQKSLALKYHHLQGSGWKRDWDGKWIKDEEAEFDSDEEPPDLP